MKRLNRRLLHKVVLWMGVMLFLFACVSPFYVPPPPAQDPGALQTSIAGTANASFTKTKAAQPPTATFTPTVGPTRTPTITPTPTATVLFIYHSPTPVVIVPTYSAGTIVPQKTPDKRYNCDLVSRSPVRSVVIGRNDNFNAYWVVRNTGFQYWDYKSVDVKFLSGGHFHKQSAYDLPRPVQPGDTVSIIIPMTAPAKPGEYGSSWTLKVGKTSFCKLRIDFTVK